VNPACIAAIPNKRFSFFNFVHTLNDANHYDMSLTTPPQTSATEASLLPVMMEIVGYDAVQLQQLLL